MNAATVIRIEKNVDRGASAVFSLACGYAAYMWLAEQAQLPLLGLETAAACALAYLLSARLLSAVQPKPRKLPVPVFDVRDVEPMPAPEGRSIEEIDPVAPAEAGFAAPVVPMADAEVDSVELTDAIESTDEDPLLLEDTLAEPESDSRVVRLFDPASMPSAGDLKSRIDRHLDEQASAAQSADAAQALHNALAELRRSIR